MKDVRGGRGPISGSDLLGLSVIEIREIEVTEFRPDLHVIERISDVGIGHFVEQNRIRIVGLDGHQGDALAFVVFGNLLDSRLVELRCWAVIADECDYQYLAGGVLFQTMRLTIYTRQTKSGAGEPTARVGCSMSSAIAGVRASTGKTGAGAEQEKSRAPGFM